MGPEYLSTLEIFYMESSKDVWCFNYPGMVVFRVLYDVEALQTQYNIWTVDKQFFNFGKLQICVIFRRGDDVTTRF